MRFTRFLSRSDENAKFLFTVPETGHRRNKRRLHPRPAVLECRAVTVENEGVGLRKTGFFRSYTWTVSPKAVNSSCGTYFASLLRSTQALSSAESA